MRCFAVSGAVAGALTATFVCPLDVLKTRLQVSRLGALRDVGIYGGLNQIARQEGIKGLYRGLTPTLMALLPNWAVYFTIYNDFKLRFTTQPDGRKVPATVASNMAAAAGAGAATLTLTNPLWVVKTRLQTQNLKLNLGRQQTQYRNTFHALWQIARTEGLSGLYSGLAPSTMGLLHVAIQLPLYEYSKSRVAEARECSLDELRPMELVMTSAISKMVASSATYPHEVIRAYMHLTGSGPISGFLEACRTIVKEDGIKGFYRGCATNLLRTTPAAALTFTSFELIARLLRSTAEKRRQKQQQTLKVHQLTLSDVQSSIDLPEKDA